MDFPLLVLSWRLGRCSIEDVEKVILPSENRAQYLKEIHKVFGNFFYLNTCQRVLLVTLNSDKEQSEQYLERLRKFNHWKDLQSCEQLQGKQGLEHLLEVISSLDSLVIGEDQIQHQFKTAYTESEPYMSGDLKRLMQMVIRTGKRLRSSTILSYAKKSTIYFVASNFEQQIKQASSLGVVGTGKMAEIIVHHLKELNDNITVYTRTENRLGLELEGYRAESYNSVPNHPVLFYTTRAETPFVYSSDFPLNSEKLIFDFGLPRNCHPEIKDLENINVFSMESLLSLSRNFDDDGEFRGIREMLDDELLKILKEYQRLSKSEFWKSFRSDVKVVAEQRMGLFLKEDKKAKRNFEKFVNEIMYISQKRFEDVLDEEVYSN